MPAIDHPTPPPVISEPYHTLIDVDDPLVALHELYELGGSILPLQFSLDKVVVDSDGSYQSVRDFQLTPQIVTNQGSAKSKLAVCPNVCLYVTNLEWRLSTGE